MWLALFLSLPLADGQIGFEFLTPSTFKLSRTWGPSPGPAKPEELKSEHLVVRISTTGQVTVLAASTGKVLLAEAAPARRVNDEIILDRLSPADEEFFGLGPRTEAHLAQSTKDHARVVIAGADRLEYLFHYGPSPKEIFEERFKVLGAIEYAPSDVELLPTRNVPRYARKMDKQPNACALVHSLVHASLSGTVAPAVNLDHYPDSEAFAAGIPLVYRDQPLANPAWRERLRPFLITYLQEVKDRGYPMLHPLPFQYPTEIEGRQRADEYLLGDELLVAPLCNGNQRSV